VRFLDPEQKYINFVLHRHHCMITKFGFHIKDLRIVQNLNLKAALIVDNLAHSYGFQIDNGVPIIEWHGSKDDCELKHMISYIIEAAAQSDVRVFNRQRLRLMDLLPI